MAAAISGLAGSCTIGGTGTLYFRSWSVDFTQAAVDVTSFGDAERTKVPGMREWSGSAEAIADDTLVAELPNSTQTVTLNADATRKYSGTAVITGVSPATIVDGESTVTVSFEGTGDLVTT